MSAPPSNWEEICANGKETVETARSTISQDLGVGKINHVNMKIKAVNDRESSWYYKIDFFVEEDDLVIQDLETKDVFLRLALDDLEYIRLRPFYCALCVGAKSYTFYNGQHKKGDVE